MGGCRATWRCAGIHQHPAGRGTIPLMTDTTRSILSLWKSVQTSRVQTTPFVILVVRSNAVPESNPPKFTAEGFPMDRLRIVESHLDTQKSIPYDRSPWTRVSGENRCCGYLWKCQSEQHEAMYNETDSLVATGKEKLQRVLFQP